MNDIFTEDRSLKSIKRHVYFGGAFIAVFLLGLGGWVLSAQISGAVIAVGSLKVNSDVKKVQPPVGGVITKIHVRDGQFVRADDAVIELDDTVALSNLTLVEKSIFELYARRDRLIAERDSFKNINFSKMDFDHINDETIQTIKENETRLFDLRKNSYDGRKAQLSEQLSQIDREIGGYEKQIEANKSQRSFIDQELDAARTLWEKKLITLAKLSALEREASRLDGERGRLQATIAQLHGKSAELNLILLQIDKDLLSEVALELRDTEVKLIQLDEQRIAAKNQLEKLILRVPQDGVVYELSVKTIGGVVGVGDVLMSIVPTSEKLIIEAKLSPADIDQIRPGSTCILRFSAFNQRTAPELSGRLEYISPDTSRDNTTGLTFYLARIEVSEQEKKKIQGFELVPGMPVEVFIKTGDRSMASILAKPLFDQLNRAFRQE